MKLEALEVLKNRRSVRKFKQEQVSREDLLAVLEAGTYAATGMGRQSPTIVAVQSPEMVAKLDAMNADIVKRTMPQFNMEHPYYGAPTILLVFASAQCVTGFEDAVSVAGNLLNAAYAVGLGSCWIHRSREMFDSEEGKALKAAWNLPEDAYGVVSIALGYADCPQPTAKPRRADYFKIIE